jgi:hypothetical protein
MRHGLRVELRAPRDDPLRDSGQPTEQIVTSEHIAEELLRGATDHDHRKGRAWSPLSLHAKAIA